MKTETYTLQRLYHEAKSLIEKYNFNKSDLKLEVNFQIEEKNTVPTLEVRIWYKDNSYNKGVSAWAPTCSGALNEFEQKLQEATGIKLAERVAVEV